MEGNGLLSGEHSDGEDTPLARGSITRQRQGNGDEQSTLLARGARSRQWEEYSTIEEVPLAREGVSRHSQKEKTNSRKRSLRERIVSLGAISAALLALILCATFLLVGFFGGSVGWTNPHFWNEDEEQSPDENVTTPQVPLFVINDEALYDEFGRFVLEDYDVQPPFSDFLPALAGYYGKPLYAFYVNRGQGIASFGIESKNWPIMEFQSANKAYQNTALVGFRTFLQISRGRRVKSLSIVEPFSVLQTRHAHRASETPELPKRYMYVGSNEMQLQEIDHAHGIETNVTFFILPDEDIGAFVKRTTIRNIDPSAPLELSVLDGLANMQPAGGKLNILLKTMGRTLEAFMGVYHPARDDITMPFYRLATQPMDTAGVQAQEAGHWCLSVLEGDEPYLLPIVYDPSKVFGSDSSLIYPVNLYQNPIGEIINDKQYGDAKTPTAFAAVDSIKLRPGESLTLSTFFGRAEHILDVPVISRRLLQPGWAQYKMSRTREVIQQITASIETKTAIPLFDGHVQQMFLDNSLRGGIPSILGAVDDDAKMRNADEDARLKVFHFFSRVHGDLERDYNDFVVAPTYFSEGPVNFRDVIQNRRNDVAFNPSIGSFNVKTFLSFIQADAYEPLSVEAVVLTIDDLDTCQAVATAAIGEADGHRAQREALTGILNSGPFRPGQLFLLMEEQHMELIISQQQFIDMVVAAAESYPMAVFESGYWADHWTYYMDLIQSYLSIYPEREGQLLFDTDIPYFFSPASVKPRDEKYVLSLSYDGMGRHVRQLDATAEDSEKLEYMKRFIKETTGWYDRTANWQHDATEGKIFMSCAMSKLFLLATLKFATRDAYGMGIEYEGGRPGWNDSNNGLVGMLGSGMPETYELLILLRYIKLSLIKYNRSIAVPVELLNLVTAINDAIAQLSSVLKKYPEMSSALTKRVPKARFAYWDTVATAREMYREKTKLTFEGTTATINASTLIDMLDIWVKEVEEGIARAIKFGPSGNSSGVSATYFYYAVTKWEETGKRNTDGHPLVNALELTVFTLPLFLEGPTRMMKTVDSKQAKTIYEAVRSSPLRDEQLRMYTISEQLDEKVSDLGRGTAFPPGWLENQAVWLHQSYKFYLELIRHDLFDQFFEEMISGGMLPFIEPDVYGRSLMECSSFIASSAFEDPSVRGRGFLARLSGSTAEFLSMWVLMMLGPNPFFINESTGLLQMHLVPALPRWMFKDNEGMPPSVSFILFGSIKVTFYHSRGMENLYRVPPTRYVIGQRDGSVFNVKGSIISSELTEKIRRVVFIASIEAYFE